MSKLLTTLKILNSNEFRRFSKYIHSPYHCEHGDTIRFFEFLEPHYPLFDLQVFESYSREYFANKLSRTNFNLLKSYLLNHVNKFLVLESLQKEPSLQAELLINNLRERKLFKEARNQLKLAENSLKKGKSIDSQYFAHELKLAELSLDIGFSTEMRENKTELETMFNRLDRHYITNSLKYLLPSWTIHQILPEGFPEKRWELCHLLISELKIELPVLAKIYEQLLYLLRGAQGKHLDRIFLILDDKQIRISVIERLNIYGYLQNYFLNQYLLGVSGASEHLFTLFQRLEAENLIFGRGEFSEHLLRNIIILSCRHSKVEWVDEFLVIHQKTILKDIGVNIYHFSKAYVEFAKGNLHEVIYLLQGVQFSDAFYRTGHQVLLLRTYYELEEFEVLISLNGTFRRFVNRSKSLSSRQKDLSRNFLSVLRLLTIAKEKGPTALRLQKAENVLKQSKRITDRTWLTLKLEELREMI